MDMNQARRNMVESQLRPNGVTDTRLIEAMASVARERFVDPARAAFAYMDEAVACDGVSGRALMAPMAFARLVQLAAVGETDSVLEVGTGTGYGAAILAHLAGSVLALESEAALAEVARRNLAGLGIANARVETGPLAEGVKGAKFDVIVLSGRVSGFPAALAGLLAEGGRMVGVEGETVVGRAWVTALGHGSISRRAHFEAAAPALPGFAPTRPAFVF